MVPFDPVSYALAKKALVRAAVPPDEVTLTVVNGRMTVKDGGISTPKLADEAVTTAKLNPGVAPEIAKAVWERDIPTAPKAGSFEEEVKRIKDALTTARISNLDRLDASVSEDAKRVWEREVPAVPKAGSFEEEIKQIEDCLDEKLDIKLSTRASEDTLWTRASEDTLLKVHSRLHNTKHVILPSEARTASGDTHATPLHTEHGSVVVFFLDVTSVSGTTPTLDVYIDIQDPASKKWVEQDKFAQVTGTGIWALALFCRSTKYSIRWVLGGTSPSFTFSVGCVVIAK